MEEIGGSEYERIYIEGSDASNKYMEREHRYMATMIEQRIPEEKRGVVIDVGAGEGRYFDLLTETFTHYIGLDFSQEMLRAQEDKIIGNNNPIMLRPNIDGVFSTLPFDVNEESLVDVYSEERWMADKPVNLIIGTFGMGGFIQDIGKFTDEACDLLAEDGKLFLSFYNKNSSVIKLYDKQGRAVLNLTTIPLPETNELCVKGKEPAVPCNYYTCEELEAFFGQYFEQVDIHTYPKEMIQHGADEMTAWQGVDEELFENGDREGYYIMIEATGNRKGPHFPLPKDHPAHGRGGGFTMYSEACLKNLGVIKPKD